MTALRDFVPRGNQVTALVRGVPQGLVVVETEVTVQSYRFHHERAREIRVATTTTSQVQIRAGGDDHAGELGTAIEGEARNARGAVEDEGGGPAGSIGPFIAGESDARAASPNLDGAGLRNDERL